MQNEETERTREEDGGREGHERGGGGAGGAEQEQPASAGSTELGAGEGPEGPTEADPPIIIGG